MASGGIGVAPLAFNRGGAMNTGITTTGSSPAAGAASCTPGQLDSGILASHEARLVLQHSPLRDDEIAAALAPISIEAF
jgi:hypothetical protein